MYDTKERTVRMLLINPRFPESFWSFRWALKEVVPGTRALNPPLGLATLAALCPTHWQVEIVDENVESVPLAPDADIIGVCGMGVQHPRQRELLAYYRRRGHYVAAGGSYASLCPEKYDDIADTVIAGEAEYIWPQFCRDYEAGTPEPLYRETGTVDLAHSVVPRFDLLQLERYSSATLQFSRGCPFRCEFCDIIVMFGRKPRVKPLALVERELDALHAAGASRIFFVDDNLIGHRPRAKELLRFLADYQKKRDYPFSFGTEASLDLAGDPELLDLFRQANFAWVFIGIESPEAASLEEAQKSQNLKGDMLTAIQLLYTYGIEVLGGFIVGFDNDTPATFEHQYRFITASGIQTAMVGLLTAIPRTPLYERLHREGRLIEDGADVDNTGPATNVMPKGMSYKELIAGYERLYRRLLTDRGIATRIRNKTRHLRPPLHQSRYAPSQALTILARLILRGILPGGPGRMLHFLHTLQVGSAAQLQTVVSDWIIGLSMRNFAERLFASAARETAMAGRCVQSMRIAAQGRATKAAVANLRQATTGSEIAVTLAGPLNRRFFRRSSRALGRLLRRTRVQVTLYVHEIQGAQIRHFEALLARLARHGDRISIILDQRMQARLAIDSSVFNLVLSDAPSPDLAGGGGN